MIRKFAAACSAALMLSLGVAACDREDARDVREGINDVEKGVDELDSDGKDD